MLEKLQPDTIVLDPQQVGNLRPAPKHVVAQKKEEQRQALAARGRNQREKNETKQKMKGKNKPSKRHRKKQLNVIMDKGRVLLGKDKAKHNQREIGEDVPSALKRFF